MRSTSDKCLVNQKRLECYPISSKQVGIPAIEKNQTYVSESTDYPNTHYRYYYTKCPECKSGFIHDSSDEVHICQLCGCVILQDTADYGYYSNNSNGSQSIMGQMMMEQFDNMHKWHSQSIFSARRQKKTKGKETLYMINKICACMFLPRKMLETAAKVYQHFGRMNTMKGKSPTSLAAAVVYLVCKKFSITCSLKEIVDLIDIDQEEKKNSCLRLAYKYCRLMIFQDIVDNSEAEVVDQNSPNLPGCLRTTNYHPSVPKPSQILMITEAVKNRYKLDS